MRVRGRSPGGLDSEKLRAPRALGRGRRASLTCGHGHRCRGDALHQVGGQRPGSACCGRGGGEGGHGGGWPGQGRDNSSGQRATQAKGPRRNSRTTSPGRHAGRAGSPTRKGGQAISGRGSLAGMAGRRTPRIMPSGRSTLIYQNFELDALWMRGVGSFGLARACAGRGVWPLPSGPVLAWRGCFQAAEHRDRLIHKGGTPGGPPSSQVLPPPGRHQDPPFFAVLQQPRANCTAIK